MTVSFNNIPSSIYTPLFYAEMDNSAANTATGEKRSLLIGLKSADGIAQINKPMLVSTASKAKTLFGAGSQLALMVAAYRNQDSTGELWVVCQEVSDDENDNTKIIGTKATGNVTITGTSTAAGTIAFYIGSTKVAVNIALGASPTSIASSLAREINAKSDIPVTAAVDQTDANIVNLTSKGFGAYANDIKIGLNLKSAVGGEETPAGIEIALTQLSGGTGVVDYEQAFGCLGDETYTFVGIGDNDTTSLDVVKTEFNDASGRWSYAKMQYGQVFTAKRGDDNSLVTFGKTRNDQHVTIFGVENAHPNPVWEISAAATGREAVYIAIDPARPTQTGPLVGIDYPEIENRFNMQERNTLLHNGIATLYVSGGYVRIERAVTTYQKNLFGDTDNSYLDSETLFTLAEITTRLKTAITSKYPRHKLANDGTRFGAGQAIVTPNVIKAELIAQYKLMETEGLVENSDLFAKYLIVERDANDPNRVNVLLPPDLVNQLRVFALLNQFRLQYRETD